MLKIAQHDKMKDKMAQHDKLKNTMSHKNDRNDE